MTPQYTAATMDQWRPKILKVVEEQATTPQGARTTVIRIDFTVGTHGPFSERFEKASFDANAANAQIQAFATSLRNIQGV